MRKVFTDFLRRYLLKLVKMMSRSYTNLLDLASGNMPLAGREKERKRFPRVMIVPGNILELDDEQASSVTSENQSTVAGDRIIVVANLLPLKAKRRPDNKGWSFSWNEDNLLLRVKDGFPEDMEVLYVGSLPVDVDPIEQDDVANYLLENVSLRLYLLIFWRNTIMVFARSSCGQYFTICCHFQAIMEVGLTGQCGKHM